MSRHSGSENQPPDELIEEVMRRIQERAERIDAEWEGGVEGWYIARANKIRILVNFDLPGDAKSLIEARCKSSVVLCKVADVIIDKRWIIILFPPLGHKLK